MDVPPSQRVTLQMQSGSKPARRRLTVQEVAQIAAQLHAAHLAELQRLRDIRRHFEWPRRASDRSADHLYQHDPNKQIFRLNSRLDHAPPPTWHTFAAPRDLHELFNTLPQAAPGAGVPSPSVSSSTAAWRAARGWAAGALLLVGALLLLRATDRFLTKNYIPWRRNRSQEWTTPNVLATSHLDVPSDSTESPSDASSSNQESCPDDLPPPYSECSSQKRKYEEPPPPYSACYVEFTNLKDGIPAVHFYNNQRQNIFEDTDAGTSRIAAPVEAPRQPSSAHTDHIV